ncbi:hypothetical protein NMG60_11033954 [Bertholletia excelsa]
MITLRRLLKVACQERDETREQLQRLLKKLTSSPIEPFTPLPQLQPTKANSSITESNSLSDAYTVSSPELSNMADSSNLGLLSHSFVQNNILVPSETPTIDQGSIVIDNIVKGRALPQKGKLMQAVLEAGPLLQTLLVAGSLPRWRNPPPLQTFNIPPVLIKGCDQNLGHVSKVMNTSPLVEMSCGSNQNTSMVNFGCGTAGSYLGPARLVPAVPGADGCAGPVKRQRFQ